MNDPIAAVVIIATIAVLAYAFARNKKKKDRNRQKSGWHIGPEIRGENYSPGMPSRPTITPAGFAFNFPTNPAHHVHYVQNFTPPKLVQGQAITVRYRIMGGGFVPQEFPDRTATLGLLIQRKGDDWGAIGDMESYRWFSRMHLPLEAGEHEHTIPLDVSQWTGVNGGQDAGLFAQALANVENIALVFGSAGGRGHGVYGPGRFEMLGMGDNTAQSG